ncbi:putative MFS multidrug transporter [Talaromyces proteolyticus]|uniref:MFS multidrug transporter n=1 Tax=Talaromyces proteolyticus TaxID=1131652 RepID=A0AAD4KYA3_9EURO|nr:putative MFS multidrug transporter [Talaromyces proteolyticus]KAH8698751.1 putative MFS multidrug transporter [Talaromyces proteolyticus]
MPRHRFPSMSWATRCWQKFAGSKNPDNDAPPLPYRQFFILALVRICEPIAFMSVFPYVYFMVESFHVTDSNEQIAVFAGMITSAFTFAEFSSGLFWGRLSDRVGRKPVLIMGLVGTAISMLCFGFAPNFPTALIARALGGLLNGNIGVLQTTVAELVTDQKQQPRAYSIMPFIWCLGSIVGPALGGALARPVLSYPNYFKPGTIFDRFPFLLPNLVCIFVLMIGITIGILFLEETHAEKKYRRDRGLELGRWLLKRFSSSDGFEPIGEKAGLIGGEDDLPDDDPPPVYRSREASPRTSSIGEVRPRNAGSDVEQPTAPPRIGFSQAFTKPVILNIIGYGILAFHSVSFDQLTPIVLSTPKSEDIVTLPFHFTGGLGVSTNYMGFMLSVQGIYSLFAQILFVPFALQHLGALRTLRLVLFIWTPLNFVVPYFVLLPSGLQIPAFYVALLGKITLQITAFPATTVLLANAIPSRDVMGSVNGVASSVASLGRALGPLITGYVHTKGLNSGISVIAWWVLGFVTIMGAIESLFMQAPSLPSQNTPETFDESVNESDDESDGKLGGLCQPQESPLPLDPEPRVPDEEVGLLSAHFNSEVSEVYEAVKSKIGV